MFIGSSLNFYKVWFWGDIGKDYIFIAARDEDQAQRKYYSEIAGSCEGDIISIDRIIDGNMILW